MDNCDWTIAGIVTGIIGTCIVLFIISPNMFEAEELGQIICDEQYGEGETEFKGLELDYNDGKEITEIKCKDINFKEFDGTLTKLI